MEEVLDIVNRFNNPEYKQYIGQSFVTKSFPVYEDVEYALEQAIADKRILDIFKYRQLQREMQPKGKKYQAVYNKRFIVKLPEIEKDHKMNVVKNHAIEYIFRNLPFKMYEECVSRERSKSYYISKENLVKRIGSSIELQSFFKKAEYKKQSKEEICKGLFKKN